MHLTRLELTDLRSYAEARLSLMPGVTLLVGPNAHGKTNLIEAVYRAATGSSHRVSSDAPLVRRGATAAYIRTAFVTDEGRERTLEMEIRPGEGSRARVDGQQVRRPSDAIGIVRAVIVAPEDLEIVRGDPGERRRLLDELLSQRRSVHAAVRQDFERVLRQRNQLLRSARDLDGPLPTLDAWTAQLVEHGAALTAARIAATQALSGPVNEVYGSLADEAGMVGLVYRSSAGLEFDGSESRPPPGRDEVAVALEEALAELQKEERHRGVTLVGPHRDDLEISVRGLPSRGYASHGQLWSLALALRLASRELLAEVGDEPVVLLDDVFAELDETRRGRLGERCATWEQVLVTTAVERDAPVGGHRLDVCMTGDRSTVTARGVA